MQTKLLSTRFEIEGQMNLLRSMLYPSMSGALAKDIFYQLNRLWLQWSEAPRPSIPKKGIQL